MQSRKYDIHELTACTRWEEMWTYIGQTNLIQLWSAKPRWQSNQTRFDQLSRTTPLIILWYEPTSIFFCAVVYLPQSGSAISDFRITGLLEGQYHSTSNILQQLYL